MNTKSFSNDGHVPGECRCRILQRPSLFGKREFYRELARLKDDATGSVTEIKPGCYYYTSEPCRKRFSQVRVNQRNGWKSTNCGSSNDWTLADHDRRLEEERNYERIGTYCGERHGPWVPCKTCATPRTTKWGQPCELCLELVRRDTNYAQVGTYCGRPHTSGSRCVECSGSAAFFEAKGLYHNHNLGERDQGPKGIGMR